MATVRMLEDLPLHRRPRVGRVCPRCQGEIVTFYRDESPACAQCGHEPPRLKRDGERIAYLNNLATRDLMVQGR